ncbi:MAG: tetratricopeptide repeat-containing glycosyltransferase family protein [Cyanobacteriota bacterium]|nr:tetratricopeptide repeat-containing glycosyltransferase family protein [Cyanobacteriota bacterium]
MGATPELQALAVAALDRYQAGEIDAALGLARQLSGHAELAQPVQAEMAHLEAACLHQQGQGEAAIEAVRRAIALDPANASYLNTYGVILRKLKRTDEAIRSYERVMALTPDFADVYYNCGNALNELDRKEEAIARFERCLQLNPSHASAHHNAGNCLRDLKRIDEALVHYARSNELQHDNPDMHCNWGLAWQLQERWDKAIDAFQTAIAQKSDHAPSHINLGSALAVQERFEEACTILRRGVQLDDSCNDAKFNLGLTLLTIGEFEEGWHFYDTRLRLPDKVRPPLKTPMWDGRIESLQGKPLLVWAEQGYGDNIQFARYVPILIEAGATVTLSTRKPLIPLLRECLAPHTPAIVEHLPAELQGFEHHVALLSLPRLCRTTKATVPMMPGYLRAPSTIPQRLQIQRQPFALHIGLVWASGVDNKDMYADKSMALEPLLRVFDSWRQERLVVLHSLQVGADAEQLAPWRGERGIVDHANELNDFLDTACVISQLDLVISVDTAVAHVAGALDKPTWTMLQHNADFRWMRGRSDTPWYPSMTLVRQRKLGDWDSVLEQLKERLTRLLG